MTQSNNNKDLDLTFLYEIADGSNEFIIESIDMLLQQAPEMLESIDTAIKAGDWSVAAASAHKLKPSMGFFGMLVSQELLQEVEHLCKAGASDPELIKQKFAGASELINSNIPELTRLRAEKEAEL